MTTLEKASKAMFEKVRARAKQNGLIFGPETQWEELPDWAQKEYADQVRVVLEALKNLEPIERFSTMTDELHCSGLLQLGAAHRGWNAMLDAILNEK